MYFDLKPFTWAWVSAMDATAAAGQAAPK